LFFPANIANQHWALVVVDIVRKTIAYYDSLGGDGADFLALTMIFVKGEAGGNTKYGKPSVHFNEGGWRCYNALTPKQVNSYDCGIFVLTCIDLLSLDIPLLFAQADIPLVRQKLLSMIACRMQSVNDAFAVIDLVDDDSDVEIL
jgi:Ulp1 family protease